MKIAILATNPNLYSHQRLIQEGQNRGHEMVVINPLKCYMNVNAAMPSVFYQGGQVLEHFDAIIPRIGASSTFYATAVLRQF